MKKKEDVSPDNWHVWILARWTSLSVVLCYVIRLPIPIQRARIAQMVGHTLGKRWDLGSLPRSPTYSIYFVLTCFHAVHAPGPTMQLHIFACHAPNNSNPKARMDSPPWTLVNTSTHKSEKSKRPHSNGLNCCKLTSKIGSTPPYVCIFFPLFILFFYLFSLCFIVFFI